MPKPTKLHPKGKTTSMQKSHMLEKESVVSVTDYESSVRQYELELCWCIQQLERNLCDKKKTEKEMQEIWKVLQVLKHNNQPVIRKRQVMRSYFGDYRAKMQAEEKKLTKMANKMKITEKPEAKATFLRKSLFQTTGDSAFRFDFAICNDRIDSKAKLGNTNSGDVTENSAISRTLSQAGNSGVPTRASSNNNEVLKKDDSNQFKFTFTGSEFKFNFDVDK